MKLLPKIVKGDLHALELLYEQQKIKVYRLILSITGDSYLAEDITQETFLCVQNRAQTYRKDISETAWIAAIARNLAYDSLRRGSLTVQAVFRYSLNGLQPFVKTGVSVLFFCQIL